MLTQLKLTNFRSYRSLDLELDGPITVIYGPNAVGKTNLLESIFVLSTSKSFRAADNELINRGKDFYRVEAQRDNDKIELAYLHSKPASVAKRIKVNSVRRSQTQLLGLHPVTLFEPNDLMLLAGPPDLRRRYMDIILSQIDRDYVRSLSLYRHLLRQRNNLLYRNKRTGPVRDLGDQLFIYDLQLAEPAAYIRHRRAELVDFFGTVLQPHYASMSATSDKLIAKYEAGETGPDEYLAKLKADQAKDINLGHTSSGPHRDDLRVVFKSRPISYIASRGEARTAVLALKLAEMDFVSSTIGRRPIFLLDDVFSELDSSRRTLLVDLLRAQQSIITTTDIHDIMTKDYQLIDLSKLKNG